MSCTANPQPGPFTRQAVTTVPSADPSSRLWGGRAQTGFELPPGTTGTFGNSFVKNTTESALEILSITAAEISGSLEVVTVAVHRALGNIVGTSRTWPPYGGGAALSDPAHYVMEAGEDLQIVAAVRHHDGGSLSGWVVRYRSKGFVYETHVDQSLELVWTGEPASPSSASRRG